MKKLLFFLCFFQNIFSLLETKKPDLFVNMPDEKKSAESEIKKFSKQIHQNTLQLLKKMQELQQTVGADLQKFKPSIIDVLKTLEILKSTTNPALQHFSTITQIQEIIKDTKVQLSQINLPTQQGLVDETKYNELILIIKNFLSTFNSIVIGFTESTNPSLMSLIEELKEQIPTFSTNFLENLSTSFLSLSSFLENLLSKLPKNTVSSEVINFTTQNSLVDQIQEQTRSLSEKLNQILQNKNDADKKLESFETLNDQYLNTISQISERLGSLQSELTKFQTLLAQNQEEITSSRETIKQTSAQVDELLKIILLLQETLGAELISEIKKLELRANHILINFTKMQTSVQNAERNQEDFATNFANLLEEQNQLIAKLEEIKILISKNNELEIQAQDLKQKLTESEAQSERQAEQIKELEEKSERQAEQIERMEQDQKELQNQLQQKISDAGVADQALQSQLIQEKDKYQSLAQELKQKNQAIQALQEELRQKANDLISNNKDLDVAKKENVAIKNQLATLQQQLTTLSQQRQAIISQMQQLQMMFQQFVMQAAQEKALLQGQNITLQQQLQAQAMQFQQQFAALSQALNASRQQGYSVDPSVMMMQQQMAAQMQAQQNQVQQQIMAMQLSQAQAEQKRISDDQIKQVQETLAQRIDSLGSQIQKTAATSATPPSITINTTQTGGAVTIDGSNSTKSTQQSPLQKTNSSPNTATLDDESSDTFWRDMLRRMSSLKNRFDGQVTLVDGFEQRIQAIDTAIQQLPKG